MHNTFRLIAASLGLSLLMPAFPLLAQDQQEAAPPAGTLIVEQHSDLEVFGTWTILKPNHDSFSRTDANLTMNDLMPGNYSFFAVPPKGTTAKIDVYLGDDVIKSSDTPQISFTLADTMTLRLVIRYSLTIYGKMGVSTDPPGVPFELKGPNAMLKRGVTSTEYEKMPVGNYSVTFTPEGCPPIPAQSGVLEAESRLDFSVKVVCKDFKPAVSPDKPSTVSAKVGGVSVTFTDVPADSWFGPYVATIASRSVMAGYTDAAGNLTGFFGPGDPVTVAQLAKIAHLIMGLDEKEFPSVPRNQLARGQWFTRYFGSAEERGWLLYIDSEVDPNRPATRGEVLATLLQILDIPRTWAKGEMFNDVERKTPYASEIETAALEGIVSGDTGSDGKPTGTFHPIDPISRAEMAKILITIHEKYLVARQQ